MKNRKPIVPVTPKKIKFSEGIRRAKSRVLELLEAEGIQVTGGVGLSQDSSGREIITVAVQIGQGEDAKDTLLPVRNKFRVRVREQGFPRALVRRAVR